jgi:hypothetical protein
MTKSQHELKTAGIEQAAKVEPAAENTKPEIPDPFSPENLRLSEAYKDTIPIKKLLTTIPVCKPGPQDFVRVHPSPEYRENFPLLELKADREEYIVATKLVPQLFGEFANKTLFLAITKQGDPFFWPVRLPSPEGRDTGWARSAREAADRATRTWIRIRANMHLGAYDIFEAGDGVEFGEPEWPALSFWDLIKIAFKDHLIENVDHPVVKRLRGVR